MNLIKRIQQMMAMLVILFSSTASAESDVQILVDGAINVSQPIAIVPFKMTGNVPSDVAQIIADDLRNSGKFSPIEHTRFPAFPTSALQVHPDHWTALGADHIVVGQVTEISGNLNIAYQLVDVLGTSGSVGNVIEQGAFNVPTTQIRLGAHIISDQIFEKLTQIRGAFRTKIAYVVQRGTSSYELRVSDYDGFNAFTVAKSREPIISPDWSPDGSKLAYATFENKRAQIIVQDLRSGNRKVIAALKGHNGAPAFSPDGKHIAFASSQDGVLNIYLTTVNGGTPRQLTRSAGNNTEPSWSPDGSSILFTSDRNGSPKVYQMHLADGTISLVGGSGNGRISSDGKHLIMVANDRVIKQDLATGQMEILTSTFLDETPSISPNGIMVIYSSTQGVNKVLQLVSADGRFKANLPGIGGQYKYPAWSPYLTKP